MAATIKRPAVRISKVGGRYLLFDIDDVMYLRRSHNICSVFVGTIPQNPQQNIFMGLPIELMPEEAQVLVDKNVGLIVDDAAFHPARLAGLDEPARRRYLQTVKAEGRKAQQAAVESKQNYQPRVSSKKGEKKQQTKAKSKKVEAEEEEGEVLSLSSEAVAPAEHSLEAGDGDDNEANASLFGPPSPTTPKQQLPKPEESSGYAITPTTSSLLLPHLPSPPLSPPDNDGDENSAQASSIDVPPSYPLYAHLQDRGYYMMPGLRFGCDYNVYPGDPLRFHSHFQATSYGWDEPVAMLDLVAGGRLGTNVKKGYLIGGAVAAAGGSKGEGDGDSGSGNPNAPRARAFCIEWAAM